MNLIYIIEIQDGERKRREFKAETLPNDSTIKAISKRGDEIVKEQFTGEEDGEWYWDCYGENMGRLYSFKVIPCDESFEIIKEILY